jgi:dienelactone hydrolase
METLRPEPAGESPFDQGEAHMKTARRMAWERFAALALACLATALPAQAQDTVADFAAGPGNGKYAFASATPKLLPDLFQGGAKGDPTTIVGHLFLPPGAGKVPAVIMLHGSGGMYNALLDFWPRELNAAGFAVFSLDRFGPRGVQSTAEDQSQVPFAADVADAFAALKLLATHPRIDPRRIAVMGFSRGGIATFRTALERVIAGQNLPDGLRFAAHVLAYSGGCVGIYRVRVAPGVFSKAPMLWVHGDADDYTPIGPCREYADRIGKAGTPVEFLVIEGAQHKFDSDDTRRVFIRGAQKTRDECPLETDIATMASYDRNTGARLQGEAYREALKACSAVGASVEGSKKARDQAAQATVAFLRKALAP